MKFGYVSDDALLDAVDFSLPEDDPGNARVLAGGRGGGKQKLYVGCAEYRVKEWKGLLYPEKAREKDMMELYTQQFRVMEMNGTHYRIYPPEQIAAWASTAWGRDFLFLPKFPQLISHEAHSLEELRATTDAFLESARAFGPHLGPLFLQMSEFFSPDARQSFFAYLATLPEGFSYFVELRHGSWFTDPHVRRELFSALRALGLGAVITDTPGRREVCHMALTIPQVMVRFVGRHRHPSTGRRMASWISRLGAWIDAGLEAAYFITHTGHSAPKTASAFIGGLNDTLGTQLKKPELQPGSDTAS